MIVDIKNTTTSKVSKKLRRLREDGGVVALTRVLTLVILTSKDNAEPAIAAANLASREHPCRIIVLASGPISDETRLDAQIRVGGDAGASEVIVLEASGELAEQNEAMVSALLLPDAPIVAWWADELPDNVSATPIGKIAHRRITDSAMDPRPLEALQRISAHYVEGDTDLAWTRLTHWRIHLASILDTLDPADISAVTVEAAADLPSAALLAAWLQQALQIPVSLISTVAPAESELPLTLTAVTFHRAGGDVSLSRPRGEEIAELRSADGLVQGVPLPVRTLEVCLAEELRRLDSDEVFGEVLTKALPTTDLSDATAASS
ncbi:glucose-6-phosphate dehydrogenase assembly protein OpcA [Nesterenkonia sp. E16_7]|uniref:glucose-6-phosphate dehydrogenase assembly protein OpcA n=1 Tax=unclassified Nesterenkonia TaxID=2629769 RepID=UPI001A93759F|nr:glucose-6-phosphate dehydrogenase assembly protein OpcA [Nesterenkonia sp. E16_10]MBO0599750.1 glucose-6-phosphate dehydrogenase assembly protein OpcA [Nesterenkonia sp. E16_7]